MKTKTVVRKHQLVVYFTLACGLSWVVEIPLVLEAQGIIRVEIPFSLHYLAAFGPLLSALIVTGLIGGSRWMRELINRMTQWRVKPGWWLVATAPLGLYLLVIGVIWLIQRGVDSNHRPSGYELQTRFRNL